MDEIDGQKQGSAFYAVKNHTKRNSTGRKFININDTQLVFVPTCLKAQPAAMPVDELEESAISRSEVARI